jgi:hypothetical protein
MPVRFAALAAAIALGFSLSATAAPAPAPVRVMIVGNFHMANPGHDIHNVQVDDVLAAPRQAEIARVVAGLARFHPTKVMAEWPADLVATRYAQYRAGTLPPSRNEVVQLGFRLAEAARAEAVYGVDVDGEFPYDAVAAYATAHGQQPLLDSLWAAGDVATKTQARLLKDKGVSATLRWLNVPANIARGNDFYRTTLRIGGGDAQPGADLLTAWYRRNFRICANIIQHTKPGDRVVVFYGAGHAFLLRQCVRETPGFELVEPNAFLPR